MLKFTAWALAIGILFSQLIQICFYVGQNADSRPVITALNNDAGNAIDVVGRSQWYRDNGFSGYGPLYFRLANTLSSVLSPMSEPGGLPHAEAVTKTWHFSLMTVSAVALVLLGLFISSLLFWGSPLWPLVGAVFVWLFLNSQTWARFLLIAHPDLLLALIVSVACWLTFNAWIGRRERNWIFYSAIAWGIAFAIKMSVVYFYPWVLLGLWWVRRTRGKEMMHFIGFTAATYFTIGFPQNFNLPRLFRFLSMQAKFSQPASAASVQEWLGLYGSQIAWPALAVLVLLTLLGVTSRVQGAKTKRTVALIASTLMLAGVPFLLLLPQQMNFPHEHYLIPIVAAQLTLFILLGQRLLRRERIAWRDRSGMAAALFATLAFMCIGVVPSGVGAVLTEQLHCRIEARSVYAQIVRGLSEGKRIYVDPYVPAMDKAPGLSSSWQTNRDFITSRDFDMMVLNANYYSRYFDESAGARAYVAVDNPAPDANRDLYVLFRDHEAVSDPQIGKWTRAYQDSCGMQTWVRVRE